MSVNLRPIAVRLARPDILFWTLPLMMILLVAGTVAQKDVGLYVAQRDYFASFLIWFGPLPFPGGYTLLGIFFINLLAKFLLFSEWEWRKAGIILSHFGVLLLIIGGGLTAISEKEGYIVIPRGSTVDIAEDYHQREPREAYSAAAARPAAVRSARPRTTCSSRDVGSGLEAVTRDRPPPATRNGPWKVVGRAAARPGTSVGVGNARPKGRVEPRDPVRGSRVVTGGRTRPSEPGSR